MTEETYEKVLRISKEMNELKEALKLLNDDSYIINLRFTKTNRYRTPVSIQGIKFNDIPSTDVIEITNSISDILDRHGSMIKKEISDRIEELNDKIKRL